MINLHWTLFESQCVEQTLKQIVSLLKLTFICCNLIEIKYVIQDCTVLVQQLVEQGRLRRSRVGGKTSSEWHIYVYVCSSTGVDFGLQTLFKKSNFLAYWSPGNIMQILGSWENFS